VSQSNADAMRQIMQRACDGTPDGVQAAAALMSEDLRMWQQGAGWLTKADKIQRWTQSNAAAGALTSTIRNLVAAGDSVAMEAVVSTPKGDMLVVMFGRFRDGKMIEGREYFPPAAAEVFKPEVVA
jgi:ketosteroid isomerase-like protein